MNPINLNMNEIFKEVNDMFDGFSQLPETRSMNFPIFFIYLTLSTSPEIEPKKDLCWYGPLTFIIRFFDFVLSTPYVVHIK